MLKEHTSNLISCRELKKKLNNNYITEERQTLKNSTLSQLNNNTIYSNCNTYLLSYHGITDKATVIVPKEVYLISLEHHGILPVDLDIVTYLFMRMGIQNKLSSTYFNLITKELMNYEQSFLHNKTAEPKYFKVYKPGERIEDYLFLTEENLRFYTGLFRFPIKPSIYTDKGQQKDKEYIKSLFKKDISKLSPEEKECVDFVINPFSKKISFTKNKKEEYYLVHENDYYTLHQTYLKKLKNSVSTNVSTKMKCLDKKVIPSANKNVRLSQIIRELRKVNPLYPLVIILYSCTNKTGHVNYPQNIIYK
jgi:hypothetical protein